MDQQPTVPKLKLDHIPLLPGFKSHRDVNRLQPWHGKKSITYTERVEREAIADADLVFHNYGPYSARPKSNNQGEERVILPSSPVGPKRPQTRAKNGRDKWLRYDRETLRFFLYFKEAVPESPLENFRVRKCVLLYYRADDTIQVHEPKVENSGLAQGSFLRKVPINTLAGLNGKPHLELQDLVVGTEIPLYGRQFMMVDCDKKTRDFFLHELKIEQPEALPYPVDPFQQRISNQDQFKQNGNGSSGGGLASSTQPRDTLKEFLKYGQKALVFKALWDDSESLYGEKRFFQIRYFLSDDTLEIREVYKPNCGRDAWPKFLRRSKMVKEDGSGEPFQKTDFICGTSLFIAGRKFLILSCDDYTQNYYETNFGIKQNQIRIVEEKKALPRMPEPPYNGFGSEEDSLGSFYNLVPRQPRKNFERQKKYDTQAIHIIVDLVTDIPQDMGRTFDLKFHLADETFSIFEPKRRNTGITGGKFLERGRYSNSVTGEKFKTDDFGVALRAAIDKKLGLLSDDSDLDTVVILKRIYRVRSGDEAAFNFFQIERPSSKKSPIDPVDEVFQYIINQLLTRRLNIREMFKRADKDNSKSIQRDEFKAMLEEAGIGLTDHELNLAMSKFNSGKDQVWYNDFCDALSTRWNPPKRESVTKIDEIQDLLLTKLRSSKTQLRVLFRNFDKDKNAKLTFTEMKKLLRHYSIVVSDEELAALMLRFDKSLEGSIDFNCFCDVVYECDFASVLDKEKELKSIDEHQEIDVHEYLQKAKMEEVSLEAQKVSDQLLNEFVEKLAQKSGELSAVFRHFSKSGGGKVTKDEFFQALTSLHTLTDVEKEILRQNFFPNNQDTLQYEMFMDLVHKRMIKKSN